jgi:hypothetical protein
MRTLSESLSREGAAAYGGFAVTLGLAVAMLAASIGAGGAQPGRQSRDDQFSKFLHQSEKWNDVGRQSRLRPEHRRLVSGQDHREPNRLARHFARRLLLPGSCLRRADVPECLEHGRLCYPPYMPCRLTKVWAIAQDSGNAG